MEKKAILGKTALVRAGLSLLIALGVLAVLMVGIALAGFGIDDFGNGQMEFAAYWSSPRVVSGTITSATGILGTERDVYVEITDGTGSSRVFVTVYTSTSKYSHSQDDGVRGYSIVTWDGTDGDPTSLDPAGLGSVDLTDGGVYSGFAWLQVSGDLAGTIVITVTTDATNYSTYTLSTVSGNNVPYFVPFSDFVAAGGGADFTDVGSIAMQVDGTNISSFDTSIDFFETAAIDLGDLPSSYNNTTLANDGARHIIGGVYLGPSIDGEGDGQESANANGDDNAGDDENGVTRYGLWTNRAYLTVTVSGGGGCLMGWLDHVDDDLNPGPDYDFADFREVIINNQYISGTRVFTPQLAFNGVVFNQTVYARFRVIPDQDGDGDCTDQTALGITGLAYSGEVEDYEWSFGPNAITLRRVGAQRVRYGLVVALVLGVVVVGGIGLFAVRRRR